MDARTRGAQPPVDLSRDGTAAGRLCSANVFHPRRTAARDGTSVLWFMGVSDDGIFCANGALRITPGFHVPGRLPASAWHWSNSRLGAFSFSFRCPRIGLLRRHALV